MNEIEKYDSNGEIVTVAQAASEASAIEMIRASMTLAKRFPRDEIRAWERVSQRCRRLRFAEAATYTYQRGGSPVTGASIRLAEALIQSMGNIQAGFDTVDQGDDWTDVECYAHDLESNTRVSRRIRVKHYRDTRTGPRRLTAERDVYEMVASYAQRRVRACILAVIPSEVVEDAIELCAQTIASGDDTPIEVRRRKMIDAFASLSIDADMLETRQGKGASHFDGDDLADLRGVFNAIRSGDGKREDYFAVKKPLDNSEKITDDLIEKIK